MELDDTIQHPKLMCGVYMLTYEFAGKRGELWLDGCCDMGACIELFRAVDPAVQDIQTYDKGWHDMRYRMRDGSWDAIPPPFRGRA